eukprot:6209893-Prorocentrum_lima.AAC.1
MTSSLVGSEMCIRDSAHTGHVSEWAGTYRSLFGPVAISVTLHVLQVAVSYTHLTLPTICSV